MAARKTNQPKDLRDCISKPFLTITAADEGISYPALCPPKARNAREETPDTVAMPSMHLQLSKPPTGKGFEKCEGFGIGSLTGIDLALVSRKISRWHVSIKIKPNGAVVLHDYNTKHMTQVSYIMRDGSVGKARADGGIEWLLSHSSQDYSHVMLTLAGQAVFRITVHPNVVNGWEKAPGIQKYFEAWNNPPSRATSLPGIADPYAGAHRQYNRHRGQERGSSHVQVEELGSGTFGKVLRTWDATKDLKRVTKEPKNLASFKADRYAQEDWDHEVKILKLIQKLGGHPSVLQIISTSLSHESAPQMVLELCRGGSLHSSTLAEPLSELEGYQALRQCCQGIAFLFEKANVLHRDLKPLNILVKSRCAPKPGQERRIVLCLGDLGGASIFQPKPAPADWVPSTRPYMAPECHAHLQAYNDGNEEPMEPYGGASDVWAIAMCIANVMWGVEEGEDEEVESLGPKWCEKKIAELRSKTEYPGLRDFMLKYMLQMRPDKRKSGSQIASMLKKAVGSQNDLEHLDLASLDDEKIGWVVGCISSVESTPQSTPQSKSARSTPASRTPSTAATTPGPMDWTSSTPAPSLAKTSNGRSPGPQKATPSGPAVPLGRHATLHMGSPAKGARNGTRSGAEQLVQNFTKAAPAGVNSRKATSPAAVGSPAKNTRSATRSSRAASPGETLGKKLTQRMEAAENNPQLAALSQRVEGSMANVRPAPAPRTSAAKPAETPSTMMRNMSLG